MLVGLVHSCEDSLSELTTEEAVLSSVPEELTLTRSTKPMLTRLPVCSRLLLG